MKNFKLFAFTVLMLSSQVSYTLDVKAGLSWCGNKIVVGCGKVQKYGEDLMIDTPTQAATVVTVVASVCAYKYYHYQAAQACFADKHPNGRIMFKSNLIYMSYKFA